jgi:L-iditol 2-dehydrogenase
VGQYGGTARRLERRERRQPFAEPGSAGRERRAARDVRALRFHGPGDLRLEHVPRPEAGPGDVLVQVEVALTDGTDLKTFRRGHPVLLGELPSPFGHEFCGIDVATGKRVVAANSAAGDERGEPIELLNGAYAEFLLVPAAIARANLLPVPPGLRPEVAAMVEPLACCLRGVERAEIEQGDRVAILGAGPIGLMLSACVADAGGRPEVVGGRAERRALVPEFGGTTGDGEGADVVIEAAGTAEAWERALELARPGGTVVYFGGREAGTELRVDTYRLHYEELTLRGAFHHAPRQIRAALAFLASGAHPWQRLITHYVRLEDVAGLLADPPVDYLKAAVVP